MVAPVPALPDTARFTPYIGLSSALGPFAVGFALYGSGNDYGNWVEVYNNLNKLTAGVDYVLTSGSGTLALLSRPITDAIITPAGGFADSGFTGNIIIIGAERPRRLNQFAENRGVTARDLNQALTAMTARQRETWDRIGRVLTGDLLDPVQPIASAIVNDSAQAGSTVAAALDGLGTRVTTNEGEIVTIDGEIATIQSQLGDLAGTATFADIATAEAAVVVDAATFVRTAGYFAAGDGGGALYKKVGSQPAHAGKFQSLDGAWWELAETVPDVLMVGADPTGGTDSADAFDGIHGIAVALLRPITYGAGHFKLSRQLDINVHAIKIAGLHVSGAGREQTILAFDAGVTSPNYYVHANSGDDVVYGSFTDFSVTGNVNGVVMQVGRDDLSDPFNEYYLADLKIANGSAGASAVGLDIGYFLNGEIDCVANGGGYNVSTKVGSGLAAVRLRQVKMTKCSGSWSLSGKGGYLTSGFTQGNTFVNIDTEACTTDWACDSANATNNNWLGGQISLATNGIDFTAGANNCFHRPNFESDLTNRTAHMVGCEVMFDAYATVGDTNFTFGPTDVGAQIVSAFTAARTWTLTAANFVRAGKHVRIVDYIGTLTPTNKLTITRAGSDTINGGTSIDLTGAYDFLELESDGISRWTVTRAARSQAQVLINKTIDASKNTLSNLAFTQFDPASVAAATQGGTGQSAYAVGDLLAGAASNTLAKIAAVAVGALFGSAGVGVAPAWLTAGVLSTSLRTPLLIGGTAAGDDLTFQTTTGTGSGDDFIWKAGTNGATERMRLTATGLGIGLNNPAQKLHLSDSSSVTARLTVGAGSFDLAFDGSTAFFTNFGAGDVAFNPSTGNCIFYAGGAEQMRTQTATVGLKFTGARNFAANGSVATAMSSLGPTGSHTTIQEWLTFLNASGVQRWVPCF